MSKKELVKQVIDRLIREGEDFSDLTQGYLSEVTELIGVSKTTIKRAKNEYKQQNESVKNNYKEQKIKKRIYKYLDRYQKATLGDLREEFPNIIPSKVSEYHLFWKRKQENKLKKNQRAAELITPRKLKEMVFNYLDEHPSATSDQLNGIFVNANRSSVSSYFNSWKKKQLVDKESVKKGSLVQVLFDFLDKKPAATIIDLQKAFADVHRKSLEIYHSLWQKKHAESEVTIVETIKQEVLQLVEKNNGSVDHNPSGKATIHEKSAEVGSIDYLHTDEELHKLRVGSGQSQSVGTNAKSKSSDKKTPRLAKNAIQKKVNSYNRKIPVENDAIKHDLIQSLESTIEAQKTIIESLNFEQQLLQQKKKSLLFSNVEMNEQELAEVKDFLAYYLQGFKQQNSNSI